MSAPRTADPALAEDLRILAEVLRAHPAGRRVRVWLFGSVARGDFDRTSDIDIALDADAPLDPDRLAALREALEEAPIVRRVDLVDMARVSPELRRRIREEGRPWLVLASD